MARKKKPGVTRTPSGQPSRAKATYQEDVMVIAQRMHVFGLSKEDAKQPMAGTFIGRLYLKGHIKRPQYDAAIAFLDVRERYRKARNLPDPQRTSHDGGGASVADPDNYVDWCANAIEKYDEATKAVTDEQCIINNRGRTLFAALDYLVLRGEEHWHLLGDLRVALNALAHHFGYIKKPRPPVLPVPIVADPLTVTVE